MHSVTVGGLGCVIMGIVVSVGAYDWVINSNLGSHGYHRFEYWFIRFQYTDDRVLWLIAVDCFK